MNPPTTSEQFAAWIKDNTSPNWPYPTFMPNFADVVIAPISGVIVAWWTRPVGWITSFTSWLSGRSTTYGLSAIVALGQDAASELLTEWYEEYCEDTNVPPYTNWVQGEG